MVLIPHDVRSTECTNCVSRTTHHFASWAVLGKSKMEFVVVLIFVVNVAFGCLQTAPEVLEDQCRELIRNFTWDVANVTSCALENSYPYRRICFQCENQSKIVEKTCDNLKNGTCCSSSGLCIGEILCNDISDLWMKNNCDACFSHADEAKLFLNVSEEVLSCLQGTYETDSQENTTCGACEKLYKNLTEMYYKIITNNSTVCGDISDAMRHVYYQWASLNCSVPMDTSLGIPNIVTTVAVALLPVVFYTGAKLISSIEDVKLFHPKRRTFVQGLQG